MKIIKPSIEVLLTEDPINILKKIERCGRLCYKSEDRITSNSYIKFLQGLIKRGHLSVLEHSSVTVNVVCDRGVSHEIVRHRIASYSQESTRYVNYTKSSILYIQPDFEFTEDDIKFMDLAEKHYNKRISEGLKPEQARYFLLTGLKTELVMTMNFREWRHFITLRGSRGAHPQIREVAILILKELQNKIPAVFDDFIIKDGLIESNII